MPPPYSVIDAATDGLYGPFDRFCEARACAEAFPRYEILNDEGDLVDWRGPIPRPPAERGTSC